MGVPFSFIHAADLHLDSPFRGLARVPQTVRERLMESTFASFRNLIEVAKAEKVDFVVLAGDLYDAADRSLRAQLRMQRMLAELAAEGMQVFAVHGNHDPLSGWQAKLDWPERVRFFGAGEVTSYPAYRRDGVLAAHVYGVSYGQANVTDNLAARYRVRPGAPFHLAVLHANVDGNADHDNYAPCRLAELAAADMHYWALGHVHDRRVLHEYPHVVYSGNMQGRSVKETGPKGAYVVRVSEEGRIELSFRDTADVLWLTKTVSVEGVEREQQLMSRLTNAAAEATAEAGGRPAVLRLRLEGRGDLHGLLQKEAAAAAMLEELREWCGPPEERDDWLWVDSLVVRTHEQREPAAAADEDGFEGELARVAASSGADPAQSRELLDEALGDALRTTKLREWAAARDERERAELIGRAAELAASLLRERERP